MLIPYFVRPWFACRTPENPKILFSLSTGPWEHLEWCDIACSGIKTPEVPISAKMTKTPIVSHRFNWRSNEVQTSTKTKFFIYLHQIRASQRFLTTLTKSDPKSTRGGPKNLNFDPAVRTGWNQRHCEDYWILVPMNIHGSKSKLERPRYLENWDDAPIDAPQTLESHNFWSDRWIFRFHAFSELGSQYISRGTHIHTFWGLLKGCRLEIRARGYISPRHALD